METGANVRWKIAIPGLGHASPIVLGNQVFIVTAESSAKDSQVRVGLYGDIAPVPTEPSHTWQLLCLSKDTGQPLWKRTIVQRIPQIKRHTKATQANPNGGIVDKEGSIHISNVALFDDVAGRGTRTKNVVEGDKKIRVNVKTGTKFSAPGMG